MFILRRITEEQMEINTCLSLDYVYISKEKSLSQFNKEVSEWTGEDTKDVYGLIVYDNGESLIPLYNESYYYIMTNDGKTFSNLSFK